MDYNEKYQVRTDQWISKEVKEAKCSMLMIMLYMDYVWQNFLTIADFELDETSSLKNLLTTANDAEIGFLQ